MSAKFVGSGNLGNEPTLRQVSVADERRPVVDMRIYFDRPKPQGDGTFEDNGGFWLTVSVWGRLGEHCARVLNKGMRVRVEGVLWHNEWEGEEGPRQEVRLTADHVALELGRVEAVHLMQTRGGGDHAQATE
jgi:single-strand DNA-binding protein